MKFHDKHGHHRLIALLLVLALCMSLAPSVFAEQVLYCDPAEQWKKAVNRTNELDVNSVTTTESFTVSFAASRQRLPSGGRRNTPATARPL